MALDTNALRHAGIAPDGGSAAAVEGRAAIFEMTQAAEDAVLRPKDEGPWSHELRVALAARIATLNGEADLAAQYADGACAFADLADPQNDGAAQGLAEVVAFMDKVAIDTRNVVAADISGLQAAGVADADIVRLAELNAFLAYQIRVIAGLRLMKGAFA
ncbi:hypothetical protein [Aliiroseovarius sp. F47248L]|uniref:hypothetical protein n=1 Tax=Aliiroseovarius sp. F47248L TaxID=2926420 RepID=UPI001FF40D91|nr:hypothetical protein [Aliiroseovarius sp. F47248L]MCK0140639.1 hypothetical protein [Aliiroseovarius sp. F47248L]